MSVHALEPTFVSTTQLKGHTNLQDKPLMTPMFNDQPTRHTLRAQLFQTSNIIKNGTLTSYDMSEGSVITVRINRRSFEYYQTFKRMLLILRV